MSFKDDKHFFVEDDVHIKVIDLDPPKKFDIQKDRFKYFFGYKVDRWIITTAMMLCFAFLFFIAWSYDFKMNYYFCPGDQEDLYNNFFDMETHGEDCLNPFYKAPTWENEKYLPPGEYGTKMGPLFNSAWPVTFILFALAFLINHLVHNKNYFKRRLK